MKMAGARPTDAQTVSQMVLLRLKKIGRAVSPQAGAHRKDKNAGSIFEQREALAPKGRGPGMGRVSGARA